MPLPDRLDVQIDPQVVLRVHDGPTAAGVNAQGAVHVVPRLFHVSNDGIPAVTHFEADVVHAVAMLVQKFLEGAGAAHGLVQFQDEARHFDVGTKQVAGDGLSPVVVVYIK